VAVGANFRFGHRAEGDVRLLSRLGEEHGFGVRVLDPVKHGERVISSSYIRNLIEDGDAETAETLLGRPFHLRGQVVLGQRRGRSMGFPTVNLAPGTLLRPAIGVYATTLERADGRQYRSVTNVGVCPTFGPEAPLTVETHILDFDEDIYGEEVAVAFHHRIRGEIRFPSPEALVEQIKKDVARARELLGKKPRS
jgi:riboflavin kinase/FMN adenylyltransferase